MAANASLHEQELLPQQDHAETQKKDKGCWDSLGTAGKLGVGVAAVLLLVLVNGLTMMMLFQMAAPTAMDTMLEKATAQMSAPNFSPMHTVKALLGTDIPKIASMAVNVVEKLEAQFAQTPPPQYLSKPYEYALWVKQFAKLAEDVVAPTSDVGTKIMGMIDLDSMIGLDDGDFFDVANMCTTWIKEYKDHVKPNFKNFKNEIEYWDCDEKFMHVNGMAWEKESSGGDYRGGGYSGGGSGRRLGDVTEESGSGRRLLGVKAGEVKFGDEIHKQDRRQLGGAEDCYSGKHGECSWRSDWDRCDGDCVSKERYESIQQDKQREVYRTEKCDGNWSCAWDYEEANADNAIWTTGKEACIRKKSTSGPLRMGYNDQSNEWSFEKDLDEWMDKIKDICVEVKAAFS